jgi:ABC-type transport system substrate-binding protein/class 3 adenylate cyclase
MGGSSSVSDHSPGAPAGERRVVSVLFADVAGSTPIGEKLGPERSKFLFDEVLRLMQQEVERLGGTVAQVIGDGIFALFGVPTAHEDDAERAVRAALAIHESLARYDADVGPAYGIRLEARVAVNTGPVVIPAAAEPAERLYNALGDTVNVAARLEREAGTGGVCVGERTTRRLGDAFVVEPLGRLALKGKNAFVSAFLVTGIRDPAATEPTGPLFGRRDELEELMRALDTLVEGAGAVVSITGEAGIGKSRLVAEARKRYGDRIRFLEGHAAAHAADSPYWPVRELVRDWLGLGLSDPEARLRIELRAGLARTLAGDADEAYPFLATLLGLPLEDEDERRIGELSRDSTQRQTVDWLLRILATLARERPLCLVFEDLEAADEPTLALLDELLVATEHEAVAVVLVHRSDPDHQAWHVVDRARRRHRHRFLELELGALPAEASRELAASRAGAELPDLVAGLLIERSGGNPFFLEQALRDLVERGALVRENGSVRLASTVEPIVVPALVQEALQARLDGLAPDTREVVAVAAVIGRSFGLPLLERLVARDQLATSLPELQRLELIVEERRQPAREYRFRHGLVQEVAYAGLVESRRRELHLAVGEALEHIYRDSLEEAYGLLAHHFREADDAERAATYLLAAGDAARMLYADDEAIDHYRAALAFLEHLGDRERARATLFKVGLTHHVAFDFARADEAYREAFRFAAPRADGQAPEATLRMVVREPGPESLAPGGTFEVGYTRLQTNLYRGLVRIDRDVNVVPAVAERINVSADGRVYRFELDPRARWSDGEPVTAGDFVLALEGMRAGGAPSVAVLADVTEAVALDERTLEVRMELPRGYFLYLLGLWWYPWPRHRVERLGEDWRRPENLLTNGPFMLGEVGDERMWFLANPYWTHPRGNVGMVELRLAPLGDHELAVRNWREGWGDLAYARERRVVEAPDTLVTVTPSLETGFLHLRNRPPLDDVRVRRALAHALDRTRLKEEIARSRDFGSARVQVTAVTHGGLIPPAMPGHGYRAGLPYDRDEALRLLEQAGHPGGRALPELRIGVGVEEYGRAIAEQYTEIGVQAQVVVDPEQQLSLGRGEVHMSTQGWHADYPDPDGMLGTLLDAAFDDASARSMRAAAATSTDRDERLRRYQALDRYLVSEQVYALPLEYEASVAARRPWVKGFWETPLMVASFDELVVEGRP